MKSATHRGEKIRRRRRAVRNFLRLAALLAGGIVGAFLLFQVFVKIAYPYRLGYAEAKKVAALNERLKKREASNALLLRRVVFLRTAEGAESVARSAGYCRPGEKVFLIDPKMLETPPADATERP